MEFRKAPWKMSLIFTRLFSDLASCRSTMLLEIDSSIGVFLKILLGLILDFFIFYYIQNNLFCRTHLLTGLFFKFRWLCFLSTAFYKNISTLILWFASDCGIYLEKSQTKCKRVFVFSYKDFFFPENKFYVEVEAGILFLF